MLHVFDDCAHEHYQRTPVERSEGHGEHSSTTIKRKMAINQQARALKKFDRRRRNRSFRI